MFFHRFDLRPVPQRSVDRKIPAALGSLFYSRCFGSRYSCQVPCLAEAFKKAGYTCGIIGKWHVGVRDSAVWSQAEAKVNEEGRVKPAKQKKAIAEAAASLGYETSCGPRPTSSGQGF